MITSKSLFCMIVLVTFAGGIKNSTELKQTVNAIVGDDSFVETFGRRPPMNTDENLRIRTHLQYIEKVLRDADVSMLTIAQKENRAGMLDLLHIYWTAGVFPKNYDYPDRRVPCFIDRDGNICAVGYLIEQTAGRAAAEKINAKHKYEYLLAMNDEIVDHWVQTSGLTKKECAMIQPTYSLPPDHNYVSPGYGISSGISGGLNLSLSVINGIQIYKGTYNKTVATVGLITGAGQVALGSFGYPKEKPTWGGSYVNPAQRDVSLINIGLGASTMVLSAWNLISNRKPKVKSVSWNIFGYPTQQRTVALGFSLKKRL